MPGIPLFHRIESDTLFALTCDLVVFCNLVYIGVEVDFGDDEFLAEPFFWIWCGIEFTIRVLGAGTDFFNRRNLCEMIFVSCAAMDVILFEKPGWLWRFSGLRSWRMLRVYQFARTSSKLKELSLVLDSMIRSSTALLYLAGVMGGVTSYTLLSLGIGVMVWATVEEARSGGDHGSHIRAMEDKEAMQEIRSHFEQSLQIQDQCRSAKSWVWCARRVAHGQNGQPATTDRKFIDYQELRDALSIPEILSAIQHLEMPVSEAWPRSGRSWSTSLDLMESIKSLTSKATPFDTCCLTARIGGTATFTTRLVTRTEVVASELQELRKKLELGIEELTRASIEDFRHALGASNINSASSHVSTPREVSL
eukprot:g23610.t1